jgi:hypothetical protein
MSLPSRFTEVSLVNAVEAAKASIPAAPMSLPERCKEVSFVKVSEVARA